MPKRQLRQAIVWGCVAWLSSCPPNFGVRSNTGPLAFGMTPQTVSEVIQQELIFVAGGPNGSDIYFTDGTSVATGFIVHQRERLWLQFRGGRLAGWTYNWDRPAAW
jgi:hypothetical protein